MWSDDTGEIKEARTCLLVDSLVSGVNLDSIISNMVRVDKIDCDE